MAEESVKNVTTKFTKHERFIIEGVSLLWKHQDGVTSDCLYRDLDIKNNFVTLLFHLEEVGSCQNQFNTNLWLLKRQNKNFKLLFFWFTAFFISINWVGTKTSATSIFISATLRE